MTTFPKHIVAITIFKCLTCVRAQQALSLRTRAGNSREPQGCMGPAKLTSSIKEADTIQELIRKYKENRDHFNAIHLSAWFTTFGRLAR